VRTGALSKLSKAGNHSQRLGIYVSFRQVCGRHRAIVRAIAWSPLRFERARLGKRHDKAVVDTQVRFADYTDVWPLAGRQSVRRHRPELTMYDYLRASGKQHHAAIRALEFKWQRILFRCWKGQAPGLPSAPIGARCVRRRNSDPSPG
jgi:hypothetical protein